MTYVPPLTEEVLDESVNIVAQMGVEPIQKALAAKVPAMEIIEKALRPAMEEVGQKFGLTRERVRQIEKEALRKLRHPSRSRKLRAFLEGRT